MMAGNLEDVEENKDQLAEELMNDYSIGSISDNWGHRSSGEHDYADI